MSDKLAKQIVDAVWNCHAQYADGTVWLDNLQAVIYVKKLLAESSTQQAPCKGPINGPCSACSAGDTAMEHHNHERAQQAPEPRCEYHTDPQHVQDDGRQCILANGHHGWHHFDAVPAAQQAEAGDAAEQMPHFHSLNAAWLVEHDARILTALKSSQQEEMARTSDNVIELAGKAVRACGGEKSKTILVARILDVELEAVHAAHLAEQAKAQEAHQNELARVNQSYDDALARFERRSKEQFAKDAAAEQTSLASQAKAVAHAIERSCEEACIWCKQKAWPLTVDCAWHVDPNSPKIPKVVCNARFIHLAKLTPLGISADLKKREDEILASQAKLIRKCADVLEVEAQSWDKFVRTIPDGKEEAARIRIRRDRILTLIKPAMLQAEEAALAAEKGFRGSK